MKKEIRLLGIDDAPFDKFKDKTVLLVGVFCRGGRGIDGVLSSRVDVDGTDATSRIVAMVKGSKFYPQLQAILLKGIAVAGLNVIDIAAVHAETGIPVIVVMRRPPLPERLARTLTALGYPERVALVERAGKSHPVTNLHVQFAGTTVAEVAEIISLSSTQSDIPEPIRIAHLIASGVILGESRGKV